MKTMSDSVFLKRYIPLLKSWTIWYEKKRYIPKILLRKAVYPDIMSIFKHISEYRYTQWQSIYRDHADAKPEKDRKRALHNIDSFLSEKCHCRIDEVRDILTDEQIGYLLDDNKRDFYETFDAGKWVNDQILVENNRTLSTQEEEILQYMKDYKERAKEYKKN